MGIALSSLWERIFGKEEVKILLLGLDAAGKTTILYKLTLGEVISTAPTIGSNQEVFQYKNLSIRMWDVGGQTTLRASWAQYFAKTKAVIFVVDSTDRQRLGLAKQELHKLCADEDLSEALLLVFANKQDVRGCLSAAQISEGLSLTELRDRQWQIVACCALTGKGLMDGMDWLALRINR